LTTDEILVSPAVRHILKHIEKSAFFRSDQYLVSECANVLRLGAEANARWRVVQRPRNNKPHLHDARLN
jgi:hypothetical protein